MRTIVHPHHSRRTCVRVIIIISIMCLYTRSGRTHRYAHNIIVYRTLVVVSSNSRTRAMTFVIFYESVHTVTKDVEIRVLTNDNGRDFPCKIQMKKLHLGLTLILFFKGRRNLLIPLGVYYINITITSYK